MAYSLCPLDYRFETSKNFYLFLNFIDLLQGILGLIFYTILQNYFQISTLVIISQIFFILAASIIFSLFQKEKNYRTKLHYNYYIIKSAFLFFYFIVFIWNIIEMDFSNSEKNKEKIVTLLFFCFFFNIFHFSWHLKMIFLCNKEGRNFSEDHENEENEENFIDVEERN